MRILLAVAVLSGGILTLHASAADAVRRTNRTETKQAESKQVAGHRHHPRYRRPTREEVECERAAWADPTGQYAGYPCWAREALSPKPEMSR
jgi:hypothetical protein